MNHFCKRFFLYIISYTIFYLALLFFIQNALPDNFKSIVGHFSRIPIDKNLSNSYLRFKEIRKYRNVDLLFAGTSHCYRAFDTRFYDNLGYKSFNMGSAAQSPLNTYYLLNRYIDTLNPKVLILEVYWGLLASNGLESFIDLFINIPFDFDMLKMGLATRSKISLNILILEMLKLNKVSYLKKDISLIDKDDLRGYVKGGFVEYLSENETKNTLGKKTRKRRYNIEKNQKRYLEKIVQTAKARNIKVILVLKTVSGHLLNQIVNYKEIDKQMERISKKLDVNYIDFNKFANMSDKKYFFDADHFNRKGAITFNPIFFEKIKSEIQNIIPIAKANLPNY